MFYYIRDVTNIDRLDHLTRYRRLLNDYLTEYPYHRYEEDVQESLYNDYYIKVVGDGDGCAIVTIHVMSDIDEYKEVCQFEIFITDETSDYEDEYEDEPSQRSIFEYSFNKHCLWIEPVSVCALAA